MTLIIAALGKDFVVLGCDSRGTIADHVGTRVGLDTQQKLVKITNKVGILLVGDACQASYFIERYKQSLNHKLKHVTEIAEDFAQFCRGEARITVDLPPADYLSFGFLVAGIDETEDQTIPKCFSLKSRTGFRLGLYTQGFGIDGKPFIADYMFAKNYSKKMNVDELVQLVVDALYDTIQIDGDVGGEIKLTIIDNSGMRTLSQDDIEEKIQQWNTK